MSSPLILTFPDFNLNIPKIAFMAVDLPEPLGPTITAISPSPTSIEHPCKISAPP